MDVRWSTTYGSFYSHEACVRLRNRKRNKVNLRSGVENNEVPVLGSFDAVADEQLSSTVPHPVNPVNPTTIPPTNPPQQANLQMVIPENSPQQNSQPQNSPSPNPQPQNSPALQNSQQPQQNSPQQNSQPQQNSLPQNSPQQNSPANQNVPVQNAPAVPSENDFYWNFEEETGQQAPAGT